MLYLYTHYHKFDRNFRIIVEKNGESVLPEPSGSFSFIQQRGLPLISGLHDRILQTDDLVCLVKEDVSALPIEVDYLRAGTEMGRIHLLGTRLCTAGQTTSILWVYVGRYIPFSLTTGFAGQIAAAVANIKANEESGRREQKKLCCFRLPMNWQLLKTKSSLAQLLINACRTFFLLKSI